MWPILRPWIGLACCVAAATGSTRLFCTAVEAGASWPALGMFVVTLLLWLISGAWLFELLDREAV